MLGEAGGLGEVVFEVYLAFEVCEHALDDQADAGLGDLGRRMVSEAVLAGRDELDIDELEGLLNSRPRKPSSRPGLDTLSYVIATSCPTTQPGIKAETGRQTATGRERVGSFSARWPADYLRAAARRVAPLRARDGRSCGRNWLFVVVDQARISTVCPSAWSRWGLTASVPERKPVLLLDVREGISIRR